ncbi:MAG: lactate permease LctP family transporter [Chloroflexi bacterium]|nr:lactate permease LctP family transporter [Chloroflexota bacterium]
MYFQNYNPTGNVVFSTLAAALPIVVLLYFIALHPHRDAEGRRHLGVSAPLAALIGVVAAFAVALGVMGMPLAGSISAFVLGVLSGFMGIIWIVVAAMLLYTITLISGNFEIVKESIIHISFDRRLQVLLIAFSFGAIIEGTSGFGTPVAIAGAMMVGLGFAPLQSAVLNLLANTAPVAWGAIGTPIITLAAVSGLHEVTISAMAGRQLPFASVLVPFWLVATFVRMEGGSWGEVWEVWPATLVAGGVFAVAQFVVSGTEGLHLLTDVISGIVSVVAVVLFLQVWHPRRRFLLRVERLAATAGGGDDSAGGPADEARYRYPYTLGQTVRAWVPWVLLVMCVGVWGAPSVKTAFDTALPPVEAQVLGLHVSGTASRPVFDMPALHLLVQRTPPVAAADARPEAAQFPLNWLSAAGTGVFVAAVLSGLFVRLSAGQWAEAGSRTARRMRIPILVIAQVLGIGFLTRYAGLDAVLGLAFTATGVLYPFFAAYLGWLGVFLTGSDTASNALFGSLQRITAEQLGLNPILIVAANSSGGVMGKMIDAQSITVATAACYEDPQEGAHAVGPIFRTVFWHSIALAAFIGVVVMLQAYVFPWMVPTPPGG